MWHKWILLQRKSKTTINITKNSVQKTETMLITPMKQYSIVIIQVDS